MNIIECKGVSKKFRWYERHDMLKGTVANLVKGRKKVWEWYVLKDLDFKVGEGEKVGIIGRNGCGKTTILKLLTGIYSPTSGYIQIRSRRKLALIELGVGFYPDLTGRENIRLNWVFNGLPRQELHKVFDEIVEFAAVGDFLETPLKYYSSGMTARLGFSIVAHAKPDLLIVDEILSVGDIEFQQKCYEKIERLCHGGVTLLIVSHNASDIERICDRAMWLEEGNFRFDGNVGEALEMYERAVLG